MHSDKAATPRSPERWGIGGVGGGSKNGVMTRTAFGGRAAAAVVAAEQDIGAKTVLL